MSNVAPKGAAKRPRPAGAAPLGLEVDEEEAARLRLIAMDQEDEAKRDQEAQVRNLKGLH